MKILVCEDDPVMMMVLNAVLKRLEYQVVCAKDGKEAVEMINNEAPDMVITDMLLPNLSGADIVSHLRNLQGKKIPVIMLSSMPQEMMQNRHSNHVADRYLLKPVLPQQLKITIEELKLAASKKTSCGVA